MKKLIPAALVLLVFMMGCKKDFLNRTPIDKLTEATAFETYDNLKTYACGLYDYMAGYGGSGSALPPYFTSQELNSDNYQTSAGTNSSYIAGNKAIPTSAGTATSSMQISQWNFAYVRRVNVMIDHIDESSMTQTEKD